MHKEYIGTKQKVLVTADSKRSSDDFQVGDGFLRIITVANLVFLAPAGDSNPAGQSLTLNRPNLTYKIFNSYLNTLHSTHTH